MCVVKIRLSYVVVMVLNCIGSLDAKKKKKIEGTLVVDILQLYIIYIYIYHTSCTHSVALLLGIMQVGIMN